MALEQIIETAIKKIAKKMQFAQVVSGVAKNITDTTCELHRTDAPVIFDVRLNAIDDDLLSFVTIYPKADSDVLVGIIEGQKTEAVVLRCSEVEKVRYKIGDNTLLIDSTGIVFNDGTVGIADVVKLVSKYNALESDLNTLKTLFSTWAPTPSDGGAALKLILATWIGSSLQPTIKQDIENTKIKH